MIDPRFWSGKKVFLTGHTGFKGSWLSLWLSALGAQVNGYALVPPTKPNLFEQAGIDDLVRSVRSDIRDGDSLGIAMKNAMPDVVFHMAAQPLVRKSFFMPVETYATNVMGTVNLLEAVRACGSVKAVVNVTTDKCYDNREWLWGYRENEPLGGYDPYSSSKACSEIVTAAYRSSYFHPENHAQHGVGIATARAGNVIGGGDWAENRLLPDCIRALIKADKVTIRNPHAVRPWQHVLEPLRGYLILAQFLVNDGPRYSEAWNFGPDNADAKTVEWVVRKICTVWGDNASYEIQGAPQLHEAQYLRLDSSKARTLLHWHPVWRIEKSLSSIVEWTRQYLRGSDIRSECFRVIKEYERDVHANKAGNRTV